MTRKRELSRAGSQNGNQQNSSGKEEFHLALLGEVGVGKSGEGSRETRRCIRFIISSLYVIIQPPILNFECECPV